ncbi:BON domain-containing protein [Myxosarcina sp. GI1(2024)]
MVAMTNEEIKTRVVEHLHWDDRVDASDVAVTVDAGKAQLSGTVPSYRAKMAAQEDARTVLGIRRIENQLQVQLPPTITAPSDSDIVSNVKSALVWNPDIDYTKIEVNVVGGVVTLRGTVDAYWKKFQAEDDAYWVIGVIGLNNELAIVPTEQWSDEAIARNIEAALERNVNVDVNDITVEVDNGRVILSGVVPD